MYRAVILFALLLVRSATLAGTGMVTTKLPVPAIDGATVRCMTMDRFGALWLGTTRGLFRFDGSEVEHRVSLRGDSTSLPNDVIYDLHVDEADQLWIATAGGVCRLHVVTGELQWVFFAGRSGAPKAVECICMTPSQDGGIWFFCQRNGLYKVSQGERIGHASFPAEEMPAWTGGGWEDESGGLWFSDRAALRYFHPATGEQRTYSFRPFNKPAPPRTMLVRVQADRINERLLWCTSWGLGFVAFDRVTGEFLDPILGKQVLSDLNNIVGGAVQINSGQWTITLDDAAFLVDTRKVGGGSLQPMEPGLRVSSLANLGKDGWLMGGVGEVLQVREASEAFRALGGAMRGKSTFVTGSRMGSGYWVAQYYFDRCVLRLDGSGAVVRRYGLPHREWPYEVFQLLEDRDGTLWASSTAGLLRIAGEGDLEFVDLGRAPPFGSPNIVDLAEDKQGRIWMAIGEKGLLCHDPMDGTTRHYPMPGYPRLQEATALVRLQGGQLLAAGRMGAPLAIDPSTGRWNEVVDPGVDRSVFEQVSGGVELDDGRILLYHRNHGLTLLASVAGASFTVAGTFQPRVRPQFSGATKDGRGRVWLMSDMGPYVFDPAHMGLHALDAIHGIPVDLRGTISSLPSGSVVITGEQVVQFGPDYEPIMDIPVLMVRRILVNGAGVPVPFDGVGPLVFGPSENDIVITFGTVSLLDANGFAHAYRLVRNGGSAEWVELDGQRTIALLDLRPGEYRLELRSRGLARSPETVSLEFVIGTPWWAMPWSIALAIVLVVLIVVLVTRTVLTRRYRESMRELEREREMERVRMRIARDIHDGIGSGLTKITMLSRQLDVSAGPQAARIAAESSDLVQELGEIVWTVDPRNDSFGSFIAYVRSTLGRNAEDLHMRITADLRCAQEDLGRPIGPDVKRNVLLVMKEAVNNAAKHSGGDHVQVVLHLRPDALHLVVGDNGHGFDLSAVREGANGLVNFKSRADALGGTAQVTTSTSGTRVEFHVPIS